MIYVVYGTDAVKARAKWHTVIDSLLAKRGDVRLFKLSADSGSVADLEELLVGQTLFDKKYIVSCDQVMKRPELAEFIKSRIKDLAAAEHMFVFLEESIEKKTLGLFEKSAFKVVDMAAKEEKKKVAGFNIFSLTDALGARDRKQLWLTYQLAIRSEQFVEEELFWKIVWQVKNLLLVKTAAKPEKLGIHPYALQKTISQANKYSVSELQELMGKLTALYHEARRGKEDLGIGLERLLLEI
ncbi:MAG TPA: hypothetical protein VEB60_02750 [Candidatus Paceibacterota bacterium]|nr:hypothetical protein [Candidatus Paceibacterota bacterium]